MIGLFDEYSLRARVGPALITTLPIGMGVAAWFPGGEQLKGVPLGVALTAALGLVLAQLARDAGRSSEARLFTRWGGRPTTLMLSHEHSSLNPHTLRAVHQKLRDLRPDLSLPVNADDEKRDPAAARITYESCVDTLRERTRNSADYPLIFQETVHYGFRRNLWAMRGAGWLASLIGTISAAGAIASGWNATNTIGAFPVIYLVTSVGLLVWWALRITPDWVALPARAYAQSLLESCLKE